MPHEVSLKAESGHPIEVKENKWLTPAAERHTFNEIERQKNTTVYQGEQTKALVEQKVLPAMSIHNDNEPAPGEKIKLHLGDGKIEIEVDLNKPLGGEPNPDAKPGEGHKGVYGSGNGAENKFKPNLSNDFKNDLHSNAICNIPGLEYSEPCIIDTLLNG